MTTQLDDVLSTAALDERERRTVRRSVAMLGEALGEDLRAIWLPTTRC